MTDASSSPLVNVLGVGVHQTNLRETLGYIDRCITNRESCYICVTGVHGIMESQRDEELRRIHNAAGMVVPDGMPLVWLSCLNGHADVERVYGPDLMLASCDFSLLRSYRHYLYGGAEGVAQKLAERLRERFPGICIVGCCSPPFRPLTKEEDDELVQKINTARPDFVWVGLGTPKQERWMAAHIDRIQASVLIGVGAAFDFHAGVKRQAPPWMQRSGLEWLFRLVTEPRRLAGRYLVNNPRFVWGIFLQGIGLRRYEL